MNKYRIAWENPVRNIKRHSDKWETDLKMLQEIVDRMNKNKLNKAIMFYIQKGSDYEK